MRARRIYMHENAMDVCIMVHKAFLVSGQSRFKVRVEWYNLGYAGAPWQVGVVETVDIKNPNEWRDITSLIFNVRTEPGLPK